MTGAAYMDTPVADFVRGYAGEGKARFHMPGHKGRAFLGCEGLDITEIQGADALYEAGGIIARSEENASRLFGSEATFFSTEGSSQCVKAMLLLALSTRPPGAAPVVAAPRNVHRSFVHAAALLDFQTVWLWPEEKTASLCRCPVSPEGLGRALDSLPAPPAAVYLTSPDYLGGMADIPAIAEVCHAHGTILAVDNAHGAYLHFLPQPVHPLDAGADICCDSAHKTLPALTGGAYLHIAKIAPASLREGLRQKAKAAMGLFGSTSPSYLTLASLDLVNAYLAGDYPRRLAETVKRLDGLRETLRQNGWRVEGSDPLRLTLRAAQGASGFEMAERLRKAGAECEYAERHFLTLMLTPENTPEELSLIPAALGKAPGPAAGLPELELPRSGQAMSPRQAVLSPREAVPASQSLGRICALPTVACPPAIPVAVAGERIGPEAVRLFRLFGIGQVDVVRTETW